MLWTQEPYTFNYPGKETGLKRKPWLWISANVKFDIYLLRDLLVSNFKTHLVPETYVTIDETRFPSRHISSGMCVFNKDKPDKWALEIYTLCDTKTSYLLDFTLPKEKTATKALCNFVSRLETSNRRRHHITADKVFQH